MKDLVIFGSGGMGREVEQLVKSINGAQPAWNLRGFLDGNPEKHGAVVHGLPILGDAAWLAANPETYVVVAIGSPAPKRRVVEQLRSAGPGLFATLVHPHATVGDYVTVGEGSMICVGSVLTTDIRIGSHVIVNTGSMVEHDVVVEDYATILPGTLLSASVLVHEGADIGTGTKIVPGITVGRWSIIGAGSFVAQDVPPNVTAVGDPAQPIKERPEGWHLS